MTDQHPITPPPELVQEWMNDICNDLYGDPHFVSSDDRALAARAAQWGSDQELEACCAWIPEATPWDVEKLRAHRRPKPPSLKEQALAKLPEQPENMASHLKLTPGDVATIRRALEQLPDDQG